MRRHAGPLMPPVPQDVPNAAPHGVAHAKRALSDARSPCCRSPCGGGCAYGGSCAVYDGGARAESYAIDDVGAGGESCAVDDVGAWGESCADAHVDDRCESRAKDGVGVIRPSCVSRSVGRSPWHRWVCGLPWTCAEWLRGAARWWQCSCRN